MNLFPSDTLATFTTTFGDVIAANSTIIISVLALGIAVAFAMRWFGKSTRRLKA